MTRAPQDSRRYKRIPAVGRTARLLIDGAWQAGRLIDISGGGAALEIDGRAVVGDRVVLSDTELGLIAGTVVRRREDQGPSLAFDMDDKRRGALVDKLTLWHNSALLA